MPLVQAPTLVSVVITSYNSAAYLCDAIRSALQQTHHPSEIVVVDDGSTDESAAVAARFPAVQLVRQRNLGTGAARNAGLHLSAGRFVTFLDGDDRLLPSAMATGLAVLAARPDCAFALGRHRYIDADGTPGDIAEQPPLADDPYRMLLRGHTIAMPATILFRREALEAAGGFNMSRTLIEDHDLYLRITRQFPIVCHQAVVAEYRHHAENFSNDISLMLRLTVAAVRAQEPFVAAHPEYRDAYRRALREAPLYYANRVAVDIRERVARGEWRQALRELVFLARYAPAVPLRAARNVSAALLHRSRQLTRHTPR